MARWACAVEESSLASALCAPIPGALLHKGIDHRCREQFKPVVTAGDVGSCSQVQARGELLRVRRG